MPALMTEVRWTTKSDKAQAHERILEIGIPTMDGQCLRYTLANAVELQWTGVKQFGVAVNGVMIELKIETTQDGHRYLRALSDGDQPESLLALPDCP